MSDALAITNLLYRYAELIDSGDLAATSELFADAVTVYGDNGDEVRGAAPMLEMWRGWVKMHPDGTPRTKHVITNPIIDLDEDAGTAKCRSYYTVLQQVAEGPLQVVAAGRYHDEFRRVDGTWRFSRRDYSMLDLTGDLSEHLMIQPAGTP